MRPFSLTLLLILTVACGAEDAAPQLDADSGDVVSPDIEGIAVFFADSPRLSLGGVDATGPTQFSSVTDLVVTDDGGIWVVDSQSQEIRVFASDGSHRFNVGGKGSGPGEYLSLRFLGAAPDGSVVAVDGATRRVGRYDLSGELLETSTWDYASRVAPLGFTSDGSLVGIEQPAWPAAILEQGGVYEDTVALLTWPDLDEPADTVAELPGFVSVVSPDGAKRLPFSSMPAVAAEGMVLVSPGAEPEITLMRGDSIERRIIVQRDPTSVARVRAEYRAFVEERFDGEAAREQLELLDHPAVPEYVSAYYQFVLNPDGHIWAQRTPIGSRDESVWDVFDSTGQLLGQAQPPARFVIHSVNDNLVTGVWRDDFGVAYVQQWQTTRD